MNVETCGSHLLRKIIACGCTISFPGVSFDNSLLRLHLRYVPFVAGTHVDSSKVAIKLAGVDIVDHPVKSLTIENGREHNGR